LRLEAVTVRAAIPENLGYLDLVRAANGGLRRNQSVILFTLGKLPLPRHSSGSLCFPGQNDWLIVGLLVVGYCGRLLYQFGLGLVVRVCDLCFFGACRRGCVLDDGLGFRSGRLFAAACKQYKARNKREKHQSFHANFL
jgi:hypothetical protein